ncbi:hypothetical protein [uncultured Winogradskyella sp.]|uniref:hypothetical protein n=1 Tax=uncultured Winogradskyella sp. TaxID=395353 RepID=UPI002630B63F|nr:hypothetical protein [uncultured Winogradskyella sp.]
MPGKTLRICLAMGGGVSLGSFSGSALTEALKLLIIHGKDEDGHPYENVFVDGMSGASAGAIALTIMLRCLIDYKSMLLKWNPIKDDENDKEFALLNRENRLVTELIKTYFNNESEKFNALSHSKKESLKALELAQKIQEIIWVKRVDAIKLYGNKVKSGYKHIADDSFGLLERKHMEGLIEEFLMGGAPKLDNLQVLDRERVLFACSLTNILPMPINLNREDLNQLQRNVINSTGVFNHAEIRVIDFIFDADVEKRKPSDKRWLKFSPVNNSASRTHFNLTQNEAWATISASALACGAFPIAFPPVLLERYQEEYNLGLANEKTIKSWMSSNVKRSIYKNRQGEDIISEWPSPFLEIQKHLANKQLNSFFKDKDNDVLDYTSFNFPYVDGGTFNNEPIKEAFRIASFQDYKRVDIENSERLILFVDPIVRKEPIPKFKVSSFSPISGTKKIKDTTEIDKLIGSVGSLVGLLKNQGRVKEDDKIRDTKENLALRDVIFSYLDDNDDIMLNVDVCLNAFSKIRTKLNEDIISIGTRNPITYFIEELRKTSDGEWNGESFEALDLRADQIESQIRELGNNISLDDIYKLLKITNKPKSINLFAATVFKVIVEVSLNTAGKNPKAIKAAILPMDKNQNIIDLPGTEIEAFAGFASEKSKNYSFQYGRLATLKALSAKDGFRDPQKRGGAYLKDNTFGDLSRITEILEQNIRNTKFFSSKNNYSEDLKKGLFTPSIARVKSMLPKKLKAVWKVPLSVASPFIAVGGTLFGLFRNITGKSFSIKSILVGLANDMADEVNYTFNESLIVSIIGQDFNKPWYGYLSRKSRIKVYAVLKNGTKVKIKASRKDKNKIKFHLYLIEDTKKVLKSKDGFMRTLSANGDSTLKLVTEHKISLPGTVKSKNAALDPFLDDDWSKALRNNYPQEVMGLKIEGLKKEIPLSTSEINNDEKSLFFSLKDLNIHVNPMLEYDMNDTDAGWYFKENTKAFHKELLDKMEELNE